MPLEMRPPTQIKFGTDGWRAIIAEDYTFENVRACAYSACQYLKAHGLAGRGLIVGYDARFASADFAAAVAEVAAAEGIKVWLSDRLCPTPVVSYSIIDKAAGGGVVITASHNPWRWNGFKYKPEYGGSASPEVVAELEQRLPDAVGRVLPRMDIADAKRGGLVETFDPRAPYLAQLARLVDLGALKSAGLRICYDAMYGTGAGYFGALLDGGSTRVTELHGYVNPIFPGMHAPEPIARNLGEMQEEMRRGAYDVGIATDGDADRVGIADENGEFINQLQVFGLLAYYMLEVRGERGPIVKSVTTTAMVQRLGEIYGVPVHETQVGFKFLGPKMMATDALIGGEESGGYGFRGHVPERDGILAGLYMLDFVARTGKRPSELLAELYAKVGPHYYDRLDLPLKPEDRDRIWKRAEEARPDTVAGVPVTARDTTDGFRFTLGAKGWLLLRFSGTEPLVRIYTEVVGDEALVPRVIAAGREIIGT
ncbi:MAG TPA: phosphoglucomutase/phosphomannomutase family protein [Dehalococcoidia bacterium]|nr:phosphoglucomutase/phosphomannomutase family protein [Dehalococcoidia bacterium]